MEATHNNIGSESTDVFDKIVKLLLENKADYKVLEHESVKTSEESAKIRNTPLEWGAKTMIVKKSNGEYVMLIYPASRKLSWAKVKKLDAVGKKF
jgi:prolyl-tRNA editing enzyme YbaK/EbsC (Cys-tRNA(Pro) deacylase)